MSYGLWLLACGAALYIVLGYPVLLAIAKGRRRPAVAKDLRFEPRVSVLMAVYNGASQLTRKLETLTKLDYPAHLLEIIVISDGSTDDTDTIAKSYKDRNVVLMRVPRGGKAAALNRGIAGASGEILFFTDVRQPLDRAALRHLVGNLAD